MTQGELNQELVYAVNRQNLENIIKFINKGAQIDAKDQYGMTALNYALSSYSVKVEIVELLLNNGANIETKDLSDNTPLSRAILNNQPEIAKYLIDKGAQIDAIDCTGNTPLSRAILNNQPEIAKYLIDKGAQTELKNDFGNTPLLLAIHQNHTEIVKCLVSKGAALYLGFNIFECLTPEIQKIIHVASVADHISEGGKLTNPEEEVKSIDSDIFLSRYKHHLSTTGYIKSYQEHIDDINKCCPVLSLEKDELIKSILQDQEDFNMECASIFNIILGVNNPMPMSMIVELLKENGDKEIPAEVQGIVDFYDQNSSLKIDNIIEYLNANYLNENDRLYKENAFKEKITQANVEVFSFKLPSIFKQSNNDDSNFARLSDFLYNSPTPVKLVEEIDTYCKLAALGNLYDEFSDE